MEADDRKDSVTLSQVVDVVTSSPRYTHINRQFIMRVAQNELVKRSSIKDTIKATKNKIHQVAGAFVQSEMHYSEWLGSLKNATQTRNMVEFTKICQTIMRFHASTRERLPFLSGFYKQIFSSLPPIQSILDIACGFNPLAIPWMGLPTGIHYLAIDIFQDLVDFLSNYFALLPIQGHSESFDVIESIPTHPVDLAFILKTIPCLEQVDKLAGNRILDNLQAKYILISYPVRSLGGRSKGMQENYQVQFQKLIAGRGYHVKKYEYSTELVYLISTEYL